MAFNVVVNSKFKPFSYQEMLHPVMMADQEHKVIDESLTELGTKANVWLNMANELNDPKAFKMYSDYSQALRLQAEGLASSGLTPETRRGMLNMRLRYTSDIAPIEQAYTRRRELQDEQRKALLLNPSLIYSMDASKTSLDDLISNPSLQPQSVSGALLTQLVGQAATNLKKLLQNDLLNNPLKAGEYRKILGGLYYERIIRDGFSLDEVLAAMLGKGPKILTDLVNNAISTSGIETWLNPQALQLARSFANQGLYNAIGDYKIDTKNNKEWDLMALMAVTKAKLKAESAPILGIPFINPRNTVGSVVNNNVNRPNNELEVIRNPNGTVEVSSLELRLKRELLNQERLKLEALKSSIPNSNIGGNLSRSGMNQTIEEYSNKVRSRYLGKKAEEMIDNYKKLVEQYSKSLDELIDKYLKNTKLYKEVLDLEKKLKQEYENTYKKYSGLVPGDEISSLLIGNAIEQSLKVQSIQGYPLNYSKSDRTEIISGLILGYEGISGKMSTAGLAKLDDNNKEIDTINKNKTVEILKDAQSTKGNSSLNVIPGVGFVVSDNDGNRYKIKGLGNIDAVTSNINKVDNYLKDYSTKSLSNAIPINKVLNMTPEELFNNHSESLGNNLYGVTIKTKEGDYQRIIGINTKNGIQMLSSSLSDELKGGVNRNRSIETYTTSAFPEILNLYSGNPTPSGTLPSKNENYQF